MTKSKVKLCVTYRTGKNVSFTRVLRDIKAKYVISFASERECEGKQLHYFQSLSSSKMAFSIIRRICEEHGNIDDISTFDTEFKGDLVLDIGEFVTRGQRRILHIEDDTPSSVTNNNVNNNTSTNNSHNTIINNDNRIQVTLNLPNNVGEETLSHITLENLLRMSEIGKNDKSRFELESFLAFARLLYGAPENVNINAARKEGTFLAVIEGEWDRFPMNRFTENMTDVWKTRFRECIEHHENDLKDNLSKEDFDEMSYKLNDIDRYHLVEKAFHQIVKERGLEMFEDIKREQKQRERKRKWIK